MKKLNRKNIGYEHNELSQTARRLNQDGHHQLADGYEAASRAEQEVYTDLNNLGKAVRGAVSATGPGRDSWSLGADVVDWLLDNDWTPPKTLAHRIISTGDNQ